MCPAFNEYMSIVTQNINNFCLQLPSPSAILHWNNENFYLDTCWIVVCQHLISKMSTIFVIFNLKSRIVMFWRPIHVSIQSHMLGKARHIFEVANKNKSILLQKAFYVDHNIYKCRYIYIYTIKLLVVVYIHKYIYRYHVFEPLNIMLIHFSL